MMVGILRCLGKVENMGLGSVGWLSHIWPEVRDVGIVTGLACSTFRGLLLISLPLKLGLLVTSRLLKLGLRRSGGLDRSKFWRYGLLERSLRLGEPKGLRKTLA